MTTEIDKAVKGLRNIRRRYDELIKEHGGKRPTNYAKMREFTIELINIIDEETIAAGAAESPKFVLPVKEELDKHSVLSDIEDKGEVRLRTRAEIEEEEVKNNPPKPKKEEPKNVFVDDPDSFKLRDEIEQERSKDLKESDFIFTEEELAEIEKAVDEKVAQDPKAKGLNEEELEKLDK